MKALRKLIPAMALLIVCAITMSASTYAWFAANGTVSATGIELKVNVPKNIQICLTDGVTDNLWANSVSYSQAKGDLYQVSSADGMKFFKLDGNNVINITGTSTSDATSTSGATDEAAGYFADFTFWVRNTGNETAKIAIDMTAANTAVVGTSSDGNEAVYNAIRFAMLNSGSKSGTLGGGEPTSEPTRFEYSASIGNGVGTNNDVPYVWTNTAGGSPHTQENTDAVSGDLNIFKKIYNLGNEQQETTSINPAAQTETVNKATGSTPFCAIPALTRQCFTIRVWLEGTAGIFAETVYQPEFALKFALTTVS